MGMAKRSLQGHADNPSATAAAASRLSAETDKAHLASFSSRSTATRAPLLFEECGNDLPFLETLDAKRLERFQFAALKLSKGKLDQLDCAIALAEKRLARSTDGCRLRQRRRSQMVAAQANAAMTARLALIKITMLTK
jgi:hypothetical protein